MLDKTYAPDALETKWYKASEQAGYFACDPNANKTPYTIMMPPPNVTGSLHMGHALTFTLQDVLIRYHRMIGRDALWQPGMDHAGIATQMVVERQMAADGVSRRDLGRDRFIERVWEWKAESGGTIEHQQRHLGVSADWERSRFTMDKGLSDAVRKVFVKLHKDGLIYRDKRLVNWDPKFQTAISDLEVEQKDMNGKMWQLHYPVKDMDRMVTVATTRPETMLGDMAVAVHPDDERYQDLVGKMILLPLTDREIPIIADEYSDPEKGTGAVKITPAHDFNDFEVGRRHNLELLNIYDAFAALNEAVPEPYQGLDRFVARDKILADMDALGLLGEIEDIQNTVPHGDRSGVPIEPWLMDQWYVDAETLAQPAIEAVRDGRTRFVPQRWEKTYFDWMENIQPWCVSRQLWWGHRIPAWYGPDGTPFVELDETAALAAAEAYYGKAVDLIQDEDVLDTWFSSALWPFSTLGWPQDTQELNRYYPGSVLVTGFDIIFFWVARMMMMSMHFMEGEVPFTDIYIHALVRDEHGQKMSKSKGNVLDPLDLTAKYGADALRFTLVAMAAQGRDLKLSENRIESYRNFATKLWNASRFLEMNNCVTPSLPETVNEPVNQWILSEFNNATHHTAQAVESYKFNEAADTLYHFVWNSYCDWYVEFIKPVMADSEETRRVAAYVLHQTLHLLSPFMPFITEELNAKLFGHDKMLMIANWPDAAAGASANTGISTVIDIISEIRTMRSEMNVPLSAKPILLIRGVSDEQRGIIDAMTLPLLRLARLGGVSYHDGDFEKGTARTSLQGMDMGLPLTGILDFEAERTRLKKEIAACEAEAGKIRGKLNNPNFVERAPEAVVAENNRRLEEEQSRLDGLKAALIRLDTE
ncbi:MAG: Valine--tRNA ligase [Alphaproteobacteria bacterium UBA4588]|nr:MAG: Valine--tRNA ligase [Alphaproteobacteria bacterium UBA4588]